MDASYTVDLPEPGTEFLWEVDKAEIGQIRAMDVLHLCLRLNHLCPYLPALVLRLRG